MLEGFDTRRIDVDGVEIFVATAGKGPPLLLLHGYPETHLMWHKVAPQLARRYRVVCPDLRGYGDSAKPAHGADHAAYSKRAMAADVLGLMRALGHETFFVAGHDRGGRVAYRLALDHPAAVQKLALLDIVSTKAVYEADSMALAEAYFHWYFLIQPAPFPETLIGADPKYWLDTIFGKWAKKPEVFDAAALAEYLRVFSDPACIHATCECYRAGATVDLENDRKDVAAGRKIACDSLILWGAEGVVGRIFKPLDTWRDLIAHPQGQALPCGHFLPEEAPEETLAALLAFFG
ncbi:MAG TPA: alpha/beta hydrolase [Burkholderiales bacterium]|jgi:haloacetate dehalogenase